jgi:hypothetical protein
MSDRHDLDSPEGYIAFCTEVADPENKLGVARMVAAEMLADGDRVRAVLKDHPGMADKFLAAQAALLREGPDDTGGTGCGPQADAQGDLGETEEEQP